MDLFVQQYAASQSARCGVASSLALGGCAGVGGFTLPWEYLYSPMGKRFLSLSTHTPIVRYLELPQKVSPLNVQAPLRILVMMASHLAQSQAPPPKI